MATDDKNLLNALSTLITLQIAIAAILAGAFWFVHQDLQEINAAIAQLKQDSGATQQRLTRIDNWESHLRPHNASFGPADAKVVITTYSDFQCPFCKTFAQSTHKQLQADYGQEVRMVFKHLPLESLHPQAFVAAVASQCANRHGNFWELHDLLFENQATLSADTAVSLGQSLGLGPEYEECVRREETRPEVERDQQDAQSAGVMGTPTFVVNGEVLQGAQPLAVFKGKIDAFTSALTLNPD